MVEEITLEIQDKDIATIATHTVREVKSRIIGPTIVEDSGLFIECLNGFPGPYSAYVYETLGCNGLLKLLIGLEERNAEFRSAIAYTDDSMAPDVMTFIGIVRGSLSKEIRGRNGFGFDPVFIPKDVDLTFGQMNLKMKSNYSHRAKSLKLFASWYVTHLQS